MDGAEHPQKDFLGQVERLVAIAQEVHRQLDDHPLVLGHELGTSRLLARCTSLHERRFSDADLDPAANKPSDALGDVLYKLQQNTRADSAYERAVRLDDRSGRMS